MRMSSVDHPDGCRCGRTHTVVHGRKVHCVTRQPSRTDRRSKSPRRPIVCALKQHHGTGGESARAPPRISSPRSCASQARRRCSPGTGPALEEVIDKIVKEQKVHIASANAEGNDISSCWRDCDLSATPLPPEQLPRRGNRFTHDGAYEHLTLLVRLDARRSQDSSIPVPTRGPAQLSAAPCAGNRWHEHGELRSKARTAAFEAR